MTISAAEFKTMWILVPHEVNDEGKIVYRKCRAKDQLLQKSQRWGDEVYGTYAEFHNIKKREGLVTLEVVE